MYGFDKIIGYEDLKYEMKIVCDSMKNPEKYKKLGAKIPRGIMLYGEPGIGKSLLAKTFCEESGRTCFIIRKDRPDGEFVNYIKETFEKAKDSAPSIIFLDDMDKFSNGDERHKDAEEYVAVQAGIDTVKDFDVFVISTVNDKYVLPDSLLRPGRFDKVIEMRCPEGEDAVKIVDFYLKQKQIADDVDAREIANILNGRSCAELETIVNEAGMYAAFDNRDRITHNDLIRSCLRYIFEAPEMLTATNNEEVRITAIHEAGHALVAEILDPGSVNLISVAGYDGNSSGITSIHKPAGYRKSKELQEHRITGVLAGKAATEIVSGTVDMGANSDIHRAFDMIEKFVDNVCAYGFDSFDRHGASSIPRENRDRMLVREMDKFYQIAKKTIIENRAFLDAIVEKLLEKQTLTGRDIARIKTEVYKDVA